jgi:hypothetical protein
MVVAATSGFATSITSATPDEAYGLAQCLPDLNPSSCLTCLDTLVWEMPSMCPGKNYLLVHDECRQRYANASFFGTLDMGMYLESIPARRT